jgi:predicted 3-demethylubiquinone-9 3-methyltransferase (glyoxalase superfamily)
MQKITPFLWFDGKAEEAAKFYVSIFKKGSKVDSLTRYGSAGRGKKAKVMSVVFTLEGQKFFALNGGPEFQFSPAISFFVTCKTQKEIDALWSKLSRGGKPNRCGWVTDRFGLTWQIIPENMSDYLKDERGMMAMMKMTKIILADLKKAVAAPRK